MAFPEKPSFQDSSLSSRGDYTAIHSDSWRVARLRALGDTPAPPRPTSPPPKRQSQHAVSSSNSPQSNTHRQRNYRLIELPSSEVTIKSDACAFSYRVIAQGFKAKFDTMYWATFYTKKIKFSEVMNSSHYKELFQQAWNKYQSSDLYQEERTTCQQLYSLNHDFLTRSSSSARINETVEDTFSKIIASHINIHIKKPSFFRRNGKAEVTISPAPQELNFSSSPGMKQRTAISARSISTRSSTEKS